MTLRAVLLGVAAACAVVVACSQAPPAKQEAPAAEAASYAVGYGPNPVLVAPQKELAPTLNVAEAIGWTKDGAPTAPAGFTVTRYAEGLDHPRWMLRLPNGDILVAESSTRPARVQGVQSAVANAMQKRAGALGPSADRITLLRDADGDGDVDTRSVFVQNLNQPFGMALIGDDFYVANTDAVVRFDYAPGAARATGAPTVVARLPYNAERNGHWTRDVLPSRDGTKLYITVGSVSNIGEAGAEAENERAAVWEFDLAAGAHRVFATGLRNPNGLAWEPVTGALWVAVNERDRLGDDLVPDYMTSVRDGAFYGWPYSYYGQNVDERVQPQRADLVAKAVAPDYALGAHTASLGLAFVPSDGPLPERFHGGALVGQHGSWNRSERSGYKVIFVPFTNGRPSGPPEDFLAGFLNADGKAQGRPVGVAFDRTGAVLVADDVGNVIWRVAPAAP
ncbi:MAG: sorbosone dehydrogenase family protein [Hyphomonadaceae bacterium]|nr:sorbosone dehydrogenase family protein [Hyphomonadaceae bacterium]